MTKPLALTSVHSTFYRLLQIRGVTLPTSHCARSGKQESEYAGGAACYVKEILRQMPAYVLASTRTRIAKFPLRLACVGKVLLHLWAL